MFIVYTLNYWESFKYQMKLRRDGGLLKRSECRHMGGWPNRHITFLVAEKSLIHSSSLYLRCMWGGWLKTPWYGKEGVGWKRQNTVIWRGAQKLLKKRHMIFKRFPAFQAGQLHDV